MDSPLANPSTPASLGASSPKFRSRSSSRASHLTLDLSTLPALTTPSPPTNTLLITHLSNLEVFHPENLQNIRDIINTHANLVSWSPLKSFRRIVCSFPSEQEAILVRQALDGEVIMGDRVRVYFGENTPLEPKDNHLHAPESKKLFFISPPPSPPHGWEVRNEEPPNAQMLAEDLAKALANLRAKDHSTGDWEGQMEVVKKDSESDDKSPNIVRSRSGSTILFEPEKDGNHMPAISVEDCTVSSEPHSPVSPIGIAVPHTARPPVELMNDC